jgi:cytochrome c-type biogenesis protein CcmH/NrfG
MAEDRVAYYQGFVDKDPNNTMAWYVLAQEHAKAGALADAVAAYRRVIEIDPAYVAAYYHGAVVLQRAGDMVGARDLLTDGLAAAQKKGDLKTAGEIQELLLQLD